MLAVPADDTNVSSIDDLDDAGRDDRDRLEDGADRLVHAQGPRRASSAGTRKAILANVRSEEPDVGGITAKLTQGAVDAGFLYVTDVEADERPAAGDRAARGAAARGRLRRRDRQGHAATTPRPRTFVDGLLDGAGADALTQGGLRAAADVSQGRGFAALLFCALALVLAFLTLPIVAIFVRTSPGELVAALDDPGVLDALWLSLRTTLIALAIIVVVGTPAAYLLATRSFRGKALVTTLVELPLVLPPAVAGVGLLAALGPAGIAGGAIEDAGHPARARDGGRRRRADVRRGAVLHPRRAGRVRVGRPHVARGVAHARRERGADVRARRDPGGGARACSPASRSRGAGRSASSARR